MLYLFFCITDDSGRREDELVEVDSTVVEDLGTQPEQNSLSPPLDYREGPSSQNGLRRLSG